MANGGKKAAAPTALQRIEMLEQTIPQLVGGINGALGDISGKTERVSEIVDTLVEVLDTPALAAADGSVPSLKDRITKRLQERVDARVLARVERERAALEALVSSGGLVAVPSVTPQSIIVGQETDPEGNVRKPGRVQIAATQIPEHLFALLDGKNVLDVVDLPDGSKFEVLEIYESAPPKEPTTPSDSAESEVSGATATASEPVAETPAAQ